MSSSAILAPARPALLQRTLPLLPNLRLPSNRVHAPDLSSSDERMTTSVRRLRTDGRQRIAYERLIVCMRTGNSDTNELAIAIACRAAFSGTPMLASGSPGPNDKGRQESAQVQVRFGHDVVVAAELKRSGNEIIFGHRGEYGCSPWNHCDRGLCRLVFPPTQRARKKTEETTKVAFSSNDEYALINKDPDEGDGDSRISSHHGRSGSMTSYDAHSGNPIPWDSEGSVYNGIGGHGPVAWARIKDPPQD